jgi:8-oxo-dGTP pyrophosphatase MutT (NUDIX family)
MGERHPLAHVKRFAGLSLIALICSKASAICVAVLFIIKYILVTKVDKKTIVDAAGGAVVAGDGRVLMMLRRGMWDLPKGHLEPGETLRECAAREVCEECGLDPTQLTVGRELVRTTHSYVSARGRPEEKRTTWFRMTYTGDPSTVTPQTEEDITALEWLAPDEAARRAAASYATIQQVIEKLIQTI